MAATMREVANLAGVGLATVSRVVNGKPGVAPELVERVTGAAEQLGYRHDITASSLRRADRRTATIGLALEDVSNPFASALHRAVEDAATARGLLVLTGSCDEDPERERGILRTFAARRVDGLIVVPTGGTDDELAAAVRDGTPVVCVDRKAGLPDEVVIDSVTVDNRDGTRAAVAHLHRHGHRRIAFLGDRRSIWTARERYAAYAEALTERGCAPRVELVRRDLPNSDAAAEAVRSLMSLPPDARPTALFSAQNLITIGARRALQSLGLEQRVALIGFDDFPLADLLSPAVTVIAQEPAAMGQAAARLLFDRLDGVPGPSRHTTVSTRFIPRGSGELPAPHTS